MKQAAPAVADLRVFKLTGKGPLLALSRLSVPEGVVLDHTMQRGCALTVALRLR